MGFTHRLLLHFKNVPLCCSLHCWNIQEILMTGTHVLPPTVYENWQLCSVCSISAFINTKQKGDVTVCLICQLCCEIASQLLHSLCDCVSCSTESAECLLFIRTHLLTYKHCFKDAASEKTASQLSWFLQPQDGDDFHHCIVSGWGFCIMFFVLLQLHQQLCTAAPGAWIQGNNPLLS